MKNNYYNVKDILNVKDLDGLKPSKYIITGNNSAGKTTSVLIYMLEKFKENAEEFVLFYRSKYEISGSHMIFDDVLQLYPDLGCSMESHACAGGVFYQLDLITDIDENGNEIKKKCGYAVPLRNPDALKKYSPVFNKCKRGLFDEFMLESGNYLPKETELLKAVLKCVTRGGGAQSREFELFMLGNNVTIMNPHFIEMGIHKRLRAGTKILRGHGWIVNFMFNESASQAIKGNRLFADDLNSNYMQYSTEDVYLFDSSIFVKKPTGKSKYLFTIIHEGKGYGVRMYWDEGLLYVCSSVDSKNKNVYTFKANDHQQNTIMLSRASFLWQNVRDAYFGGYLRFDSLESKNMIFDILGVDLYS